ncbi:unnamed protein product [Pleuronectes platessa]|uniref:Uncharacterized protein n=1 Tax=Pleuronectes platessa TaxID=8262 RepID=A0A9N7Z6Z2_PLEPL|nr:unnamed protein product [Pleuronectes platessa]
MTGWQQKDPVLTGSEATGFPYVCPRARQTKTDPRPDLHLFSSPSSYLPHFLTPGNGEELTSGLVASRACGPQVEAAGEPVLREDQQAAKRIERFHIPLESLKKMFEKPAVTDTACY